MGCNLQYKQLCGSWPTNEPTHFSGCSFSSLREVGQGDFSNPSCPPPLPSVPIYMCFASRHCLEVGVQMMNSSRSGELKRNKPHKLNWFMNQKRSNWSTVWVTLWTMNWDELPVSQFMPIPNTDICHPCIHKALPSSTNLKNHFKTCQIHVQRSKDTTLKLLL